MSAFSTPAPLVSTQWLADHLGADDLVVLDATVLLTKRPGGGTRWLSGLDQYLIDGHIPGTVFADVLEVFSDPDGEFGFARPSAELFEAAAASVGIDNSTTVVVYDSSVGHWAARIWWLFRAFGYDNVAVLDGGYTKWTAEERPTETGFVEPRSVTGFTAAPRDELWVDKAFVEAIVAGEADAALVCSAPSTEFSGAVSSRPRAGHIPGSVSVPASRLVDRETNAFLQGDVLDATLAPFADASRFVTYCGGGVAAASSAFALVRAGQQNVAIYDGSLNEWAADADAPLVVTV